MESRAADGGGPDDRVLFLAAVASAPAVVAARERAGGAEAQVGVAGRFPDPLLEAGYADRTAPEGDSTMWEAAFEQPLPRWGERDAERRQSTARAQVASRSTDLAVAETAAEAARRLAEVETARRRLDLLDVQIRRAEGVLGAEDARVAAGRTGAAERLELNRAIADMRRMRVQEARMAADAAQDAAALLGVPVSGLPPYQAPTPDDVAGADLAPGVTLASAMEQEALAEESLARSSGRPMTAIRLRAEREAMDAGDEDTVGVALMTDLPWGGRARARAETDAARAEGRANRQDADGARRAHTARLEQARRAEDAAAATRRLAMSTEAQLEAKYTAWVTSAGLSDAGGTLRSLLDILDEQTNIRRELAEAEGEALTARAELWLAMPAEAFRTEGEAR